VNPHYVVRFVLRDIELKRLALELASFALVEGLVPSSKVKADGASLSVGLNSLQNPLGGSWGAGNICAGASQVNS